MTLACECPYCRALRVDDRPPAHVVTQGLAELAEARQRANTVPTTDRRRSRRGPVPR